MNERRRLLDDHPGDLESLLMVAMRTDRPSQEARDRALVGVSRWGLPVLLGFWAKNAIAHLSPWAKLGLCVVAVGTVPATAVVIRGLDTRPEAGSMTIRSAAPEAVGAPHAVWRDSHPPPTDRSPCTTPILSATPAPLPPAQVRVRGLGSPVPSIAAALKLAAARSEVPNGGSDVTQPAAAGPSSGSLPPLPADGVDAEAAALHAIRGALSARDAGKALALLDEYRERFPIAHLATEAAVLRVQSLVVAGNRNDAEALGRTLIEASPNGPHARRIRAVLGWIEQ